MVNKNKSVLHPCQILQFLGMEKNSKEMSVSLPQGKKDKIISQCQGILKEKSVSMRELTQVRSSIFHSHCSVSGTSLVSIQHIAELTITKNFDSMIVLTEKSRKELQWWVGNLQLIKEKTLINSQPQITVSIDSSLEGWGAYCQGQKTEGPWTSQKKNNHINVLELRAVK